MYRAALRSSPRTLGAIRPATTFNSTASRRFLTTAPADNRRTWKGFAARWGLAIAAVYWYNTSPIFADEPVSQTIPPPSTFSDSDLPTVEAVLEQKRQERLPANAAPITTPTTATSPTSVAEPAAQSQQIPDSLTPSEPQQPSGIPPAGSPEALEEEAGQQGAFNPETGEINWDCPCLGGMAHGPCGEEFKAAFSCFVYSSEEPKGMDCIDKFQHMQDCFRQYPDIYGAELQDDEDDESAKTVGDAAAAAGDDGLPESGAVGGEKKMNAQSGEKVVNEAGSETVQELKKKTAAESDVIPKAAVDATAANDEKKA